MPRPAREPAYARIAREIAAVIASGEVGVGQRLPTEAEIGRSYKVSRHTAREALRLVDSVGLVERRQGSGTRVKAQLPPARFNRVVQSIEDLLDYGSTSRLVFETARRDTAARAIARLLQMPTGTPVIHLTAQRFQPQWAEPIALVETYVILRSGVDAKRLLDQRLSIYALLRLVDLRRLARVEQTFAAASASSIQASKLGVKVRAPVLVAQRRYFGADGQLLLVAVSTHRADRYVYSNQLTRQASTL